MKKHGTKTTDFIKSGIAAVEGDKDLAATLEQSKESAKEPYPQAFWGGGFVIRGR